MKQQFLNFKKIALWVTALAATNAVAQNNADRVHPEPQRNAEISESFFNCNPLTINGKPLDYRDFSVASIGVLAVVAGNPDAVGATRIPFRIYLQRDGKRIGVGASNATQVDLAPVLTFAKPGDYLIVEPTRKCDWRAKRTVLVKESPFLPNWFSMLTKSKDGC